MIRKMECGSFRNGKIAKGCELCLEGSKMVLFITGICGKGCYYCPVSFEKKEKNVVYANESKIIDWDDIFEEADSMGACGTGITGGDPLKNMDRTIRSIESLKKKYGKEHHIHLYTATMDVEKSIALKNAGLDELRIHPPLELWESMESTCFDSIAKIGIDVGVEVPALPDREKELDALLQYLENTDVKFVNLNELEFSESNWDMMESHGYQLKGELSSSIAGSAEIAKKMAKKHKKLNIHFCSSAFKDGVQLRRRLIRKAERVARNIDVITEDGTLMKGLIYGDCEKIVDELKKMDVPSELIIPNQEMNRVETAPWILEKISCDLPFKSYIVEEYPTADRLEVERTPLK